MTTAIPAPPEPLSPDAAPKAPDSGKPTRMLQLDILRGVAILLVIGFHDAIPATSAGFLKPFTMTLDRMGWSGVDLFFVLSGFLIGGLLFKELLSAGRIDVRRFIIRRAFKIWPSYYVYLLYLGVLLYFTNWIDTPLASKSLIPNLLHVQNYARPPRGHTWSLAVEEHFYLLLPFLLAFLVTRGGRMGRTLGIFPYIAATVAVVCLFLRYLTSFHRPWMQYTHYFPTHLRIDGLFFGVTLAYLYYYRPNIIQRLVPYRLALLIAGIILVSPAALYNIRTKLISVPGFSLLYLGYGCILLAVVLTPIGKGIGGRILGSLPARAIAFIGVYSYPIYLWHVDCARMPLHYLGAHGFLGFLPGSLRWLVFMVIYVAVATAVGVLMGRLVETPALALRDRLFPSRITPLVTENTKAIIKTVT